MTVSFRSAAGPQVLAVQGRPQLVQSRPQAVVDRGELQQLAARLGALLHHLGAAHAALRRNFRVAGWLRPGWRSRPATSPARATDRPAPRTTRRSGAARPSCVRCSRPSRTCPCRRSSAPARPAGSKLHEPAGQGASACFSPASWASSNGPACRHSGRLRERRRRGLQAPGFVGPQDAHRLRLDLLLAGAAAPTAAPAPAPAPAACRGTRRSSAALASSSNRTVSRSMSGAFRRQGRTLTSELVTVFMPPAVCTSNAPRSVVPWPVPAVPSLSTTGTVAQRVAGVEARLERRQSRAARTPGPPAPAARPRAAAPRPAGTPGSTSRSQAGARGKPGCRPLRPG